MPNVKIEIIVILFEEEEENTNHGKYRFWN